MDKCFRNVMEQMVTWGAQTVGNAMTVKSINNIGRPIEINNNEDAKAQSDKVFAISQELWDVSVNECKQPTDVEKVCGKFLVKIFDWANKHICD